MKIPKTSIIVARKGPAENAGSMRNSCNKKGKQLPSIVASNTIIPREKPMVKLSIPVPPVHHTRPKATAPKIVAKKIAITNSRLIKWCTFDTEISPVAIP